MSKVDQKWAAKVSTKLEKATAGQIWPLFEDFFGLHKWFPGLPTCYGIHGTNGEPGCIRYCSGFGIKTQDSSSNDPNSNSNSNFSWSKEKLVAIDRSQMTFTYEIVDCNIGFRSYVSTVNVVPEYNAVEWCISLDPVAGWKLEDLVAKYQVGLRLMVDKMEAAVLGQ